MYVRRVAIEKIKGFHHVEFEFQASPGQYSGWYVITGENGSGKTVLLKSIALALLGPSIGRVLQPELADWPQSGHDSGVIAVELVASDRDRFRQGRRYEKPFWAELRVEEQGTETGLAPGKQYRQRGKGPTNGPWASDTEGWLAVGYGPFRRLYGTSTEAQRLMSGTGRVSRFATLFREDATLAEAEAWLRELEFKRLEGVQQEATLLESAKALLNADFLSNGYVISRIDSNGLFIRDRRGTELSLQQLSEGYRAALAMLIDIFRHATAIYGPGCVERHADGSVTVECSGVVLIDEIDAHLHPRWQQMIGFWLKRHFPRLQFLVTTHSAFVCQAADKDSIYHLPGSDSDVEPFRVVGEDYEKIIRARPDQIYLSPAFQLRNTRSEKSVEERARFASLKARQAAGVATPAESAELQSLLPFMLDENQVH